MQGRGRVSNLGVYTLLLLFDGWVSIYCVDGLLRWRLETIPFVWKARAIFHNLL